MQLTINIPEAHRSRVIDAFANRFNYPDQIVVEGQGLQDNPQTKAQFAKAMLIKHIQDIVKDYELEKQRQSLTTSDINID